MTSHGEDRMAAMFSLLYCVVLSLPVPLIFTVFGTVLVTAAMYGKTLISKHRPSHSTHLVYMESALAKHVLATCKTMTSPMQVPFWARNAHVQTLLFHVMPKTAFYFDREFILMRDRGVVGLDWGMTSAESLSVRSPILIIVPDIVTDTCDLTHLAKTAVKRGFRPVVFNRRGHGGCPLTTTKIQTFGDPTDLRQVIKYIRGNYPAAKMAAMSHGAGSGVLLSYLGEYGSSTYLSAGVCISPVFDAQSTYSTRLPQPYDFLALLKKKQIISRHYSALKKSVDMDMAMRANTLAQFEDVFYSKCHGYRTMGDYWEKNDPLRDIDDVSVPVLCIYSEDDPVHSSKDIPYDLFRALPNFLLVRTERGGHCAFLHGPNMESWADTVTMEYLTAVSAFLDKDQVKDKHVRAFNNGVTVQRSPRAKMPRVANRISF